MICIDFVNKILDLHDQSCFNVDIIFFILVSILIQATLPLLVDLIMMFFVQIMLLKRILFKRTKMNEILLNIDLFYFFLLVKDKKKNSMLKNF